MGETSKVQDREAVYSCGKMSVNRKRFNHKIWKEEKWLKQEVYHGDYGNQIKQKDCVDSGEF